MISEKEVEEFNIYHLWGIRKKPRKSANPNENIDDKNDIWEMTDSEDEEEEENSRQVPGKFKTIGQKLKGVFNKIFKRNQANSMNDTGGDALE